MLNSLTIIAPKIKILSLILNKVVLLLLLLLFRYLMALGLCVDHYLGEINSDRQCRSPSRSTSIEANEFQIVRM